MGANLTTHLHTDSETTVEFDQSGPTGWVQIGPATVFVDCAETAERIAEAFYELARHETPEPSLFEIVQEEADAARHDDETASLRSGNR